MDYFPIINISLAPSAWNLANHELTRDELKKIRNNLSRFRDRFETFAHCLVNVLEDESLPDPTYESIDRAYDKLCKMDDYAEEGIDVIDEILDAWDKLENDLTFVFNDVASVVKGGM